MISNALLINLKKIHLFPYFFLERKPKTQDVFKDEELSPI